MSSPWMWLTSVFREPGAGGEALVGLEDVALDGGGREGAPEAFGEPGCDLGQFPFDPGGRRVGRAGLRRSYHGCWDVFGFGQGLGVVVSRDRVEHGHEYDADRGADHLEGDDRAGRDP